MAVIVKQNCSLLVVAFHYFPDQAGIFEQIPVAKGIEFAAGGDDVGCGDRFKAFILMFR